MGFIRIIRAIGGFLKKVVSPLVDVFIEDFGEMVEKLVRLLMFAAVPGGDKFAMALAVVKGYALAEGKKFVNHGARLLIEMEVTEARGDKLEDIIDHGLEEARKAVNEVATSLLSDDDDRRKMAVNILRERMVELRRTALTKTHLLNVLIEIAVAQRKKEEGAE